MKKAYNTGIVSQNMSMSLSMEERKIYSGEAWAKIMLLKKPCFDYNASF